jgi:hypothetical protein
MHLINIEKSADGFFGERAARVVNPRRNGCRDPDGFASAVVGALRA